MGGRALSRDPWNARPAENFLWTNTNVGEAIPDVTTPLTWAYAQVFLRHTMARASVGPYRGWGRIDGRVYLNVSVMRSLAGAAGMGERTFRRLTAEIFGRIPDAVVIPRVRAGRAARLGGLARLLGHVVGELRATRRVRAAYLGGHVERCARARAAIAATGTGPELARLEVETLGPDLDRICWLLAAVTRAAGAWFVGTRIVLRRLVGAVAANALTAGLGDDLASLGPLEGLDRLSRGEIDRDTFEQRYGHRGPAEFELSMPRPGEDPSWGARHRATGGYADLRQVAQRERTAAWTELGRQHRWLAQPIRRAVATWARLARDREQARGELARSLGVLRAYAVRAGTLTGLGDDVFLLDAAELRRVLRGEAADRGLLAERRSTYAAYRALGPYPGLIRGSFDPCAARPGAPTGGMVTGFPGSAGVVEGRVRVLTEVADGAALQPGEVLVTTVTNVGWTPLFPCLAAVVTDVGAPLSHAAIVARELGLPAVVGCGDATRRLRTGDRVRVDGAAGTVEVLP